MMDVRPEAKSPMSEAEEMRQDRNTLNGTFKLEKNTIYSALDRRKRFAVPRSLPTNSEARFVASVQRISDNEHLCVANLITLKKLITSCSCVINIPGGSKENPMFHPELYKVIAGSIDLENLRFINTRFIYKLYRDPRCFVFKEYNTWTNNLGYIELRSPFHNSFFLGFVSYSISEPKYIHHLYKYFGNQDYDEGGSSFCATYGWGDKTSKANGTTEDTHSKTLQKARIQFLKSSDCLSKFWRSEELSDHFSFEFQDIICAVCTAEDFQWKDRGIPLICGGKLLGIGTVATNNANLIFFQKLQIYQILAFTSIETGDSNASESYNKSCLICHSIIIFIFIKPYIIIKFFFFN
ncbi:uncharacterized protein LOC106672075 isoform X2 [Cimex lectularius]|uniref:Peptidase S1 domain-containing protein n=1 Tax=Cimex lectularius TaxID=79782 RepID=A0A8I6SUK3_CIMLE|nr:uncharacterized protein LOC106672075 isoform X2 [Cimex lectularius]